MSMICWKMVKGEPLFGFYLSNFKSRKIVKKGSIRFKNLFQIAFAKCFFLIFEGQSRKCVIKFSEKNADDREL
jgi:hypothetical protein